MTYAPSGLLHATLRPSLPLLDTTFAIPLVLLYLGTSIKVKPLLLALALQILKSLRYVNTRRSCIGL